MNNNLLNCQGTPQPLDNILEKIYVDALKEHIERHVKFLERKKREIEDNLPYTDAINIDRGIIVGINMAISQLEEDIDYLERKYQKE